MAYVDSADFISSAETVEKQFGTTFNRWDARKMLLRMYELKGRGKFGKNFRRYRNQAMEEHGLKEGDSNWEVFKSFLVGYFQPRAVREAKRLRLKRSRAHTQAPEATWKVSEEKPEQQDALAVPLIQKLLPMDLPQYTLKERVPTVVALPVIEASAQRVELWVYNEVYMVFSAIKPDDRLKWEDVDRGRAFAVSGPATVEKHQRWRAKVKALATMNKERGFKKKKRQNTAQFALL